MKNKLNFFLIIFLMSLSPIYSQSLQLEKVINLNFNAHRFSVNENKESIFFINQETNEIIKTDFDANIIRKIGGFGWGDEQFDLPSDIVSTALEVYVSDFNNHAIKRYDFNLNFISSISSTNQIIFEFPSSIALTNIGELYILDSKHKFILKLKSSNKVEGIIGNYERGKVFFKHPRKIRVDNNLNLYVLDENYLFLFDQFGKLINTLELDEKVIDFYPTSTYLFLLVFDKILRINDDGKTEYYLREFMDEEMELKQIEIKLNKIYLLATNKIFVFKEAK